jgi:4-amino-4-deoxy-L-arabinose transferase-like glycosyltransferase
MLQHQDYLNPHLIDGTLRTQKPILTYWIIIVSYSLMGVNFFAARLPFLVAGVLTLWVTYRMAMQLLGNSRESLLAIVILSSNIQFVMLCLRSTPDILHTLFLNVSLLGFLAFMFQQDLRLRNYIYAYCGAALAIETKGLLGFTPIAFAFLFLLVSKKTTSRIKHMINLPVIGVAAVVALSWYGYVLIQHGPGSLFNFFSDQVSGKLGGSNYYVLLNIKEYLWGVFRNFLPWSLLIAAGYAISFRTVNAYFLQRKHAVMFIVGWFLLLFLIFIVSNDCRTRYLVPAYPLLSILFAAAFGIVIEHKLVGMIWKWSCLLLLAMMTIGGLAALLGAIVLDWRLAVAGMILLGLSLPSLVRGMKSKCGPMPIWMGLIMLTTTAGIRGFVLPVFEFAPAEQLTACILKETDAGRSVPVWATRRQNFTQQLYTISEGRILMHYFPRHRVPDKLDDRSPVILSARDIETLSLGDYSIELCGFVFRVPYPDKLWQAIRIWEKEAILSTVREPLYLAWRRKESQPRSCR